MALVQLKTPTSPDWVQVVMGDFDAFLADHAACERKASAMGVSLVQKYPDRLLLIAPLIQMALEEMAHFQRVWAVMEKRGLKLGADTRDEYMGGLLRHVRQGRDEGLLDRLLVVAVVEARGHERFGLVAQALPPGELKDFYDDLTRSEARHISLFVGLARKYFEEDAIQQRLSQWLEIEGQIVSALPLRAAVH